MKKITLLLISLFLFSLVPLSAQKRSDKRTESVVVSYYAPVWNVVEKYFNWDYAGGIKVDYLLDYNISNTPLFVGFGGEVGYLLNHYSRENPKEYSYEYYQDTFHTVYLGIPVQFGGAFSFGKNMTLKPFIRLTPLVAYNNEKIKHTRNEVYKTLSKFSFGGIAPQLGASLNISKLVLSLSYSFIWDSYGFYGDYWRCGENGFNIGIGYCF